MNVCGACAVYSPSVRAGSRRGHGRSHSAVCSSILGAQWDQRLAWEVLLPRIAEGRAGAAPSSAVQKDRYQRVLRAAARLGATSDYERVQMHDVAKAAGVAIATLYRYFPSKAHLFTAVMGWQVDRFQVPPPPAGVHEPADLVANLLVGMTREMVHHPQLSLTMIQANNKTQVQAAAVGEESHNDRSFRDLVLTTAGIADVHDEDQRRVRLVVHCWYGVLTSVLNGRIDMSVAEGDISAACRLLMDGVGNENGDAVAGQPSR